MSGVPRDKSENMLTWLTELFRCPDCHAPALYEMTTAMVCADCHARFPIVGGRPVLIRTDNALFPLSAYTDVSLSFPAERPHRFRRLLPSRSVNMAYRRTLHAFAEALDGVGATAVLVIGAGSSKRWLDEFFGAHPRIRLVYTDVDIHGTVDVFCDAHDLPYQDGTFGGVIASAVLEHVAYPEQVVSELYRVLSTHGFVYSEIPFLQQVHEGAYDFTRYTLSGHRRLLNHFEEMASGVVAGPGTTLAWALEHFAVAGFPRRLETPTRLLVRAFFFWLKYCDYFFGESPAAADGASCTFFLGKKSASRRTVREIVDGYSGFKPLRHV